MAIDILVSSVTHSRSVLRRRLLVSSTPAMATTTSADFSLRHGRRPFRHEARSPQVRTHTFIAQPPHLRHLALVTRALRFCARSPCLAAPSMQFLFIGSRFMLHASSPRSVTLTQLRFTSLAVTSSWRDLHPQVCAHAGRTQKKTPPSWAAASPRGRRWNPVWRGVTGVLALHPPAATALSWASVTALDPIVHQPYGTGLTTGWKIQAKRSSQMSWPGPGTPARPAAAPAGRAARCR